MHPAQPTRTCLHVALGMSFRRLFVFVYLTSIPDPSPKYPNSASSRSCGLLGNARRDHYKTSSGMPNFSSQQTFDPTIAMKTFTFTALALAALSTVTALPSAKRDTSYPIDGLSSSANFYLCCKSSCIIHFQIQPYLISRSRSSTSRMLSTQKPSACLTKPPLPQPGSPPLPGVDSSKLAITKRPTSRSSPKH
jgi:hypothetical protein